MLLKRGNCYLYLKLSLVSRNKLFEISSFILLNPGKTIIFPDAIYCPKKKKTIKKKKKNQNKSHIKFHAEMGFMLPLLMAQKPSECRFSDVFPLASFVMVTDWCYGRESQGDMKTLWLEKSTVGISNLWANGWGRQAQLETWKGRAISLSQRQRAAAACLSACALWCT